MERRRSERNVMGGVGMGLVALAVLLGAGAWMYGTARITVNTLDGVLKANPVPADEITATWKSSAGIPEHQVPEHQVMAMSKIKIPKSIPHSFTEEEKDDLDQFVAAVAGCMTGTLAGALVARKIPVSGDRLMADAEGLIENVDGHPLLTRIKVHYLVKVPRGQREEAKGAIAIHEKDCPASRSVQRGIAIEWDGEITEVD